MWIADNKPVSMPLEMISCKWGWMMCPPGDQFVTGSLRAWGVYSETEIEILKKLAHNKRVLVIGGNIGALAAPVGQMADYIEVYEPQPVIAQVLEANMALANCPSSRVYNAAVGATSGIIKVPVVRFDADCNMGRIGKENWGVGQDVILDDINVVLKGDFDLVVIDAEGMELEILKAVRDRERLPDLMWVECDRPEEGKELIQLILDYGYSPFWMCNPLTPNGMSPDSGDWPMQASFNLLCVKQPALFPLANIPQFPASVEDSIGNCPADMLIWKVDL